MSLKRAFQSGNEKEAIMWVRMCSDVNTKDDHDFTPLMYAVKYQFKEVIQLLLERQADVSVQNIAGDTALHLACQNADIELTKIILDVPDQVAVLNIANDHGNTALHYACYRNDVKLVELLIKQYGALIGSVNKYGKIPLDFARPSLKSQLKDILTQSVENPIQTDPIVLKSRQHEEVELFAKAKHIAKTKRQFFDINASAVIWGELVWMTDRTEMCLAKVNGVPCIVKRISDLIVAQRFFNPASLKDNVLVKSNDFNGAIELLKLRIDVLQKLSHISLRTIIGACLDQNQLIAVAYENVNTPVQQNQIDMEDQLTGTIETLDDLIHSPDVELSSNQVLRWLHDISQAMQFLHDNGSHHLSLMPRNIVVVNAGNNLQLIDYGLYNTILGQYGDGNSVILDPQYVAPELLSNGRLCENSQSTADFTIAAHKADIYSFGMLIYELVTRQSPFEECQWCSMQLGLQVVLNQARPSIPDYFPPHLKKLMELCWQTLPQQRPNFADVSKVLQKIIDLEK
ncbi:hypothetical protein MIR68_003668 [Amoeboaphelidium protococcarum]|nr:hypothetical protein MIR68_003668 [Amoeboaphelidium protococcarum]